MNNESKDWLRVWQRFSQISRQKAATAEKNLMELLMEEIKELLRIAYKTEPSRRWTLHKIMGNYVRFHNSSSAERKQKHQYLEIPISKGLIGIVINGDKDVDIFTCANKRPNYSPGWEECQSELIVLVKDSKNHPIGVINIESDNPNDFSLDDCNIDSSSKDLLVAQLKQLVRIASDHISLIFRNESLEREESTSTTLMKTISKASIYSSSRLKEIISQLVADWLNNRAKVLRAVVYITEPENENLYKRLVYVDFIDSVRLINEKSFYEIENIEELTSLSEQGLHKTEKSTIISIFGEEFANSLLPESENADIFFEASDISDSAQNISIKYFIGITLAKQSSGNDFENVQTCFEIVKNVMGKYLQDELKAYGGLVSETTVKIYKTILQEDNFRVALNKISAYMVEETGANLCMIYLATPSKLNPSQATFYLAGVSKEEIDFARIRFNQDRGVVSNAFTKQESYYHHDFYSCAENRHLLDRHLRGHGLQKPEVYAFPLSRSNTKLGALMLFRENLGSLPGTNRPNQPNKYQVEIMLNGWMKHLSNIIYEKQKQADAILSKTFKRIIEILPGVASQNDAHQSICNLQVQVTDEVLTLWNEIMDPARFVIYKKNDEEIKIFDQIVLSQFNDSSPPRFTPGKGLTGSVLSMSEVYEPFMDDLDDDINEPRNKSNRISPDWQCKQYWDHVLGDERRVYYGRHARISGEDYIFIIIGVRQNEFFPPLGYNLVYNIIDVLINYVRSLL
jgi:putative methionine-R-sulfoxide reductase with GAF domain